MFKVFLFQIIGYLVKIVFVFFGGIAFVMGLIYTFVFLTAPLFNKYSKLVEICNQSPVKELISSDASYNNTTRKYIKEYVYQLENGEYKTSGQLYQKGELICHTEIQPKQP